MPQRTILLPPAAPPKPAAGRPCNGCGVCCAVETCPVARVVLLRRRGPCPALEWQGDLYRCGLLARPRHYLPWLPDRWDAFARRLLGRWIAAGRGCDSTAEISN